MDIDVEVAAAEVLLEAMLFLAEGDKGREAEREDRSEEEHEQEQEEEEHLEEVEE